MLISSYIAVMLMTNSADKRQFSVCLGHGKLTLWGELYHDVNLVWNAWIPSWLCVLSLNSPCFHAGLLCSDLRENSCISGGVKLQSAL